ncbi:hypothetical protein [Hymenobacter lapidarius]|uniref:hypothetical protein n=1 Tax=Hymenobacter lapidarius TaxID=1908237 RepID=UPI00195F0D07|nr:hypothetical protein [Hymenobacter lapidarius]
MQAAENLWREGVLYARPWPRELPSGQAVQEFTIRPVGYPLALLVLGGLLKVPFLALLFQNLLSLLNLGLVLRWWARTVRPQRQCWKWAVVLVLLFPAQLIYANAVMSEMLLQTMVVGIFWGGMWAVESPKPKYMAGVAAATVLALLLKPVFYPMALVVAGAGTVLAWRQKEMRLAAIAGIPMLVAGLYLGWNMQRTGYLHFSSIAEINLLHYNAAGVVRQVSGPEAEEAWVAAVLKDANQQVGFAERQLLIRTRALVVISEHPVVYARQHMQGMGAVFFDPGRFDISQFLGVAPPPDGGLLGQIRNGGFFRALTRLPIAMLALLGAVLVANLARMALAVRGFLLLGNRASLLRNGRWIAAGLLFYVALLTGPLGAARFLVPVWPLLLGLALVGLKAPGVPQPQQRAPMGED